MPKLKLTPTEQRLYDLTADGEPHTREEMMGCLEDELAEKDGSALTNSIYRMRIKLNFIGQDLIVRSFGNKRPCKFVRVMLLRPQDAADSLSS